MRTPYPKYFYFLLTVIPVFLAAVVFTVYCGYVSHQAKISNDTRIKGDWPITADEVLGFGAARNASTLRLQESRGLTFNLFTDKRGARVNSIGQQTPDHVEILTVGGSYSWGHGIENEKTFTEILGRTFNVPVANFAYGSYGTVQSLQLLERNSDLKPGVIIYGFITDHVRRNLSPCAPSYSPYCIAVSYFALDETGEPHIMKPVKQYSSRVGEEYYQYVGKDSFGADDVKWGAKAIVSQIKKRYVWEYEDNSELRQKSMKWLMDRMARAARRINSTLMVVHIPKMERERTNPAPSELVDALHKDTLFIDLSGAVRQHYADPDSSLLCFEQDGHPNELANELIAGEIIDALKASELF